MLLAYPLLLVLLFIGMSMVLGVAAQPHEWPDFGSRLWWMALLPAQLLVTILLCPGLTAAAISGERERGTLDLLFLTPISAPALVLGKFFGAIGQFLLVVFSGAPIVSVVFLYGGVTPADLALGLALLVATGVCYAALGFLASCLFRRTAVAMAWAYGFMLCALILLPFGLLVLTLLDSTGNLGNGMWPITTNPVVIYGECATAALAHRAPDCWWSILALFGEGMVILAICAWKLHHLRGGNRFTVGHVSPEVARFNSRPSYARVNDNLET